MKSWSVLVCVALLGSALVGCRQQSEYTASQPSYSSGPVMSGPSSSAPMMGQPAPYMGSGSR